jgi:hypothetical protein
VSGRVTRTCDAARSPGETQLTASLGPDVEQAMFAECPGSSSDDVTGGFAERRVMRPLQGESGAGS